MKTLTLLILTTIPILFAAVQPFVWVWYAVAMYAVFVLALWGAPEGFPARPGKVFLLTVGVFLGVTLLQCLPLPDALLARLSPARFALLAEAQTLTGRPPVWPSLGYYPLHGLAWWGFLLGLALFYRVLEAQFRRRRMLRLTLWLLFGLAVAQAIYGLMQALVPNMGTLWVDYIRSTLGNARGTWINRNHFAGYMEMMIPLLLGFLLARIDWRGRLGLKTLLQSDRPHQHALFLLGLILMALALVFSKSRAGIVGGFVGLAVFLALLGAGGRRVPAAAWLVVSFMAAGVLFYGGRIGIDPVLERFLALSPDLSRIDIWRDSLAMIADHPLGIGLAAFKPVFPLYNTSALPAGTIPWYLHNDVLQLVTDAGWIGAAALLAGLAWFMGRAANRLRRMDPAADPERFFPAAGALSGITALVFHSFFDFNLQMPANAVYFVMLMAVVQSCTTEAKS